MSDLPGNRTQRDSATFDPVTAGTSFTRTIEVEVSATSRGGWNLIGDVHATVGADVTVLADQYGFAEVGHHVYPDASLKFAYIWKSTTGNLSDLAGTKVYEHLTYSGDGTTANNANGLPYFIPINPPFSGDSGGYPNPIDPYQNVGNLVEYGSTGHFVDRHGGSTGLTYGGVGSYTGSQTYKFSPSMSSDANSRAVKTSGSTMASHTIVRTVTAPLLYHFTITKDGVTGSVDF